MRLKNLVSRTHPFGNRVSLTWINPRPEIYPGVRIVRRLRTHPVTPEPGTLSEGVVAADILIRDPHSLSLGKDPAAHVLFLPGRFQPELDRGHLSEALRRRFHVEGLPLSQDATVRLEALGWEWWILQPGQRFLIRRKEPREPEDKAAALEVFAGLSGFVDDGIPGETVAYYTLYPFSGDPPVFRFHPRNRTAALASSRQGMAERMQALLPRIYHRYDASTEQKSHALSPQAPQGALRRFLELGGSQLEILYGQARASLHLADMERTHGRFLPLLGDWIGWRSDLNLEISKQRSDVRHAPAVFQTRGIIPAVEAFIKRVSGWESRTKEYRHNILLSNEPERLNLWMCTKNGAEGWVCSPEVFSLDHATEGRASWVRDGEGLQWLVYHTRKNGEWDVWCKTRAEGDNWGPSRPLTRRDGADRHPTAAWHADALWLFWERRSLARGAWSLRLRKRSEGIWSEETGFQTAAEEARAPDCVADAAGGLWLFWLARRDGAWRMQYNRHDGRQWELAAEAGLPADGEGRDPGPGSRLFLLPAGQAQGRLWLFWSRKRPAADGRRSFWTIYCRIKESLDPRLDDWGPVRELPLMSDAAKAYHDLSPAARLDEAGQVEVYWSSNRSGGWGIWHSLLDPSTLAMSEPEAILDDASTCTDPVVFEHAGRLSLLYRSNRSLEQRAGPYGATHTLDHRYAGSTALDTSNQAKVEAMGTFSDSVTYTMTSGPGRSGPGERRLFFYNVAGFFIDPLPGESVEEIEHKRLNLKSGLPQWMPVNTRGEVIVEPKTEQMESRAHFDLLTTLQEEGE